MADSRTRAEQYKMSLTSIAEPVSMDMPLLPAKYYTVRYNFLMGTCQRNIGNS